MLGDDLKKLLSGPRLFRLDAVLGISLVPVFYALGLCAIGLWAIYHLFDNFAYNFGMGLWGILEIIVYAPLAIVVLRIACEVLEVFFTTHAETAGTISRARVSRPLIDEVGDAIHDLADDDESFDDLDPFETDVPTPGPIKRGPAVKRTARRSPPPK